MSREELMKLTVKELDGLCRERNIPLYNGKNHISKPIMIERLLDYAEENPVQENVSDVKESAVEKTNKPTKEVKKETKSNGNVTIGDLVKMPEIKEEKKEEVYEPWVLGNKAEAIEKAEVGTLIAFIDEKGKPRTAKLVNRSSSRQVVKVTTEFDWTFIVPYDKVLWVRFGNRWPKTIYNMLKGYKNGNKPNVITKEEH